MNATTIKPGDRVRAFGRTPAGTVDHIDHRGAYVIHADGKWFFVGHDEAMLAPRMSLPARTLLAAWHASDRTLHKLSDHVCGLDRIRRYGVTATDGLAVDLTLTTEVQL
jgi:hypothetical protein